MLIGIVAHPVTVECHIAPALPSTTIVGLPDNAIREAKDRVRAAIRSSGFDYPDGRIVINLAPGDLAKQGSFLDLPIALSVLAASRQISCERLAQYEFVGELGLYGDLKPGHGTLSCAIASARAQRRLVAPASSGSEIHLAKPGSTLLARGLLDAAHALKGTSTLPDAHREAPAPKPPGKPFAGVIGQRAAQRALTIAAAGGHHALMVGPPGVGKTMLARGFTELLPDLDADIATEVAALHAAAGLQRAHPTRPPLRDPHHSASATALVGGGRNAMPGETSLAHGGVLFLDELPHFKPAALDLLREPLEAGEVSISRASYRVTYPCRLLLLAAMNPCPAGRICREDACRCTPAEVLRYQKRVSGPLLDRIDLHVAVPEVPLKELLSTPSGPTDESEPDPKDSTPDPISEAVANARKRQTARQRALNSSLTPADLATHIAAADEARSKFADPLAALKLSARSLHKIWKIARTIADLADERTIAPAHLAEAIGYRSLNWDKGVGLADRR